MQNAADILLLLLSLINEQNMLMSVVCTPQVDRRPIIKLNSKHDLAFDFAAFIDMFVKQFSMMVASK